VTNILRAYKDVYRYALTSIAHSFEKKNEKKGAGSIFSTDRITAGHGPASDISTWSPPKFVLTELDITRVVT